MKNNDVFCLADYPYRATTLDSLKSLPDDENRDIAIWLVCYNFFVSFQVCELFDRTSLMESFKVCEVMAIGLLNGSEYTV